MLANVPPDELTKITRIRTLAKEKLEEITFVDAESRLDNLGPFIKESLIMALENPGSVNTIFPLLIKTTRSLDYSHPKNGALFLPLVKKVLGALESTDNAWRPLATDSFNIKIKKIKNQSLFIFRTLHPLLFTVKGDFHPSIQAVIEPFLKYYSNETCPFGEYA